MKTILKFLNDIKLKTKLRGLYIFCVVVPIILTDGVILYSAVAYSKSEQLYEMQDVASAIKYSVTSKVDRAEYIAGNIYLNKYLDDYLNEEYDSPADYVAQYHKFSTNTFFVGSTISVDRTRVYMYTDNPTIISGGEFQRIASIEEEPWYIEFKEEVTSEMMLFYYFDEFRSPHYLPQRKILLMMKLDHFSQKKYDQFLKVELDYGNMVRDISNMNFVYPVYLCQNNKVLLSNELANNSGQNFEDFTQQSKVRYQESFKMHGQDYQIYVLEKEHGMIESIGSRFPLIFGLILFNVVMPWLLMNLIEHSITARIRKLELAFEDVDSDKLKPIEGAGSRDEIGALMINYNRMTERMNELIQTVYKDKLREQDISIAKQNAELLALHSQINPHFLFNVLESIRMHSILKEEDETADMVQRLAIMERQYVDWSHDRVEVQMEMKLVEAYLGLQKYRFGERLSYQLDIEEECVKYLIPKMTIVTFVENACVHGIETKSTLGWIFVRVYQSSENLCIEIEDTGGGIEEERMREIAEDMQEACIERIQKKKSVGIQNACLRIKMETDDTARFSLESEPGVGTMFQITIPLKNIKRIGEY